MENADFVGIQSQLDSILTCEECDEMFQNKHNFSKYTLIKPQIDIFKCDNCGECCKTSENIRMHF